jgi:hypothetical protein
MVESKVKKYIAAISALFSLFSIFIFNPKVIDEITTGFGWPLEFLLFYDPFSTNVSKDIIFVLKNFHITSIHFRIELLILNALLYYFVILLLFNIFKKTSAKPKK